MLEHGERVLEAVVPFGECPYMATAAVKVARMKYRVAVNDRNM